MSNLERKVDLLLALVLAEEDATRQRAKEALRAMADTERTTKECSLKHEVEALLKEIGVPSNLKGHECLTVAICKVVEDPSLRYGITKILYPMVANAVGEHRATSRVDRNIRHAIEVAWERGDTEIWRHYFGNTASGTGGKPTNSEFISQIASEIQRRVN